MNYKYADKQPYLNFIKRYSEASNAATGSDVDSNANVEVKTIASMETEAYKREGIAVNRLAMQQRIEQLFDEDLARQYIDDLERHKIYRHDETAIVGKPYCASITLYPFLLHGLEAFGGSTGAPHNLDSFVGGFINLVYNVSSNLAGAVATPEFLPYLDYFIRKDYGNDYYHHSDTVVDMSARHRTIDKIITDCFEQVVYSINQPSSARGAQSVFWNISFYDRPYFEGLFQDFVFPDGTEMQWESVSWLQKRFMKWFNAERLKKILTFPVESVNLLDNGKEFVDKEWADFAAEMWSEGHSFFLYRSDSVDSLSSCCYSGDTKVIVKDSEGAYLVPIKEVEGMSFAPNGYRVFNNGKWSPANFVKLPARKMYEVTTSNNKKMIVTDNHRNNCLGGMKLTKDLTTDDYLMFNNTPVDACQSKDEHLSYEQGFAVGAFLGDGSLGSVITLSDGTKQIYDIIYSISEPKEWICDIIDTANKQLGGKSEIKKAKKDNLLSARLSSKDLAGFITRWTNWYRGMSCYTKEVNMDCLLQSVAFRQGILDGWYATDGNMNSIKSGYSMRGYSTSQKLIESMEAICTSLGYITSVSVDERIDNPIFNGVEYQKRSPVYCLLRYAKNKQAKSQKDLFVFRDNSYFMKIKSIREVEYDDEYVYCFEMKDKEDDKFTLPNGIHNFNCRLRNEIQDNQFSYTLGAGGISTGSKCVMTINLNRLIQDMCEENYLIPSEFWNDSRNLLILKSTVANITSRVHKYLMAFNTILLDRMNAKLLPIYDGGFVNPKRQYLTVGM